MSPLAETRPCFARIGNRSQGNGQVHSTCLRSYVQFLPNLLFISILKWADTNLSKVQIKPARLVESWDGNVNTI